MLNYEEIENITRLKKLSLRNIEKDYLQDLILFSIYSFIGKELVFKGGTCLYKLYKLGRFSEDLDFTLTKDIDIKKVCNKIVSDLSLFNIKSKIKEIKEYKNEINVRLLINGPLYKGRKETQCFIPLNISKKERLFLEPNKESVISIYKEIPNFEVFAMQEKEILAEKIRAVFTRLKARDIYDLWFLAERKNILFDLNLANKKLFLYNLKFDFKVFNDKVEKMKWLWEIDIKNLIIGEIPEFKHVKKRLLQLFN